MQLSGNSGVRGGQFSMSFRITLPITTVAYASGQVMGGLVTFPVAVRAPGQGARLITLFITDRSSQKSKYNIIFFDSLPTLATLTDHAPFSFSGDDIKGAALVSVAAADWTIIGAEAVSALLNVDAYVRNNENSQTLYAAVIAANPAHYLTTSDLNFVFAFYQD